jgi:hypothetical protein
LELRNASVLWLIRSRGIRLTLQPTAHKTALAAGLRRSPATQQPVRAAAEGRHGWVVEWFKAPVLKACASLLADPVASCNMVFSADAARFCCYRVASRPF